MRLRIRTLVVLVILGAARATGRCDDLDLQTIAPPPPPADMKATPAQAEGARDPFAATLEGSSSEGFRAEGEANEEPLETDRDSFTPAATVVGRGLVIVESSYTFIDNRVGAGRDSFPELLTRIGLTDWFELRLGGNYETGGNGAVSGGELGSDAETPGRSNDSNVLYGFKIRVSKQHDWLPRSVVIVQATTPTSGPETATELDVGYAFGWTLPNGWNLDSSIRYIDANEEGDHFNQWAPSIVLKIPVGESWNIHAEYFGIFSQNRETPSNPQYFSPGIHYLVSPNCEVGVRTGWGLNSDAADFFVNVGIGVRF
jgi:hypothetical protein